MIAGGNDHNIYYHSLYDNKILRQFRGHAEDVTNISMCPANDQFLSSAKDGSVRYVISFFPVSLSVSRHQMHRSHYNMLPSCYGSSLWTLQEAGCIAKMELPEGAQGAYGVFDGSGLVFGIAASGSTEDYIHLYDARNYTTGAFGEFKILHSSIESVIQKQDGFSGSASALSNKPLTSFAFNASGNQLLATGQDGLALLLDGFEGTIQKSLCSTGIISACFTPDDKTVLMGNKDGTISCWSVDSGKLVKHLGGHTGPVGCIAANPTKEQFASSCTSTALWLW